MYRTQVSPHKHGFLVERQYDASDRGTWITVDRYFSTCLDQPRKEYKPWMGIIHMLLNQHSAELPPIEIPIAPPIAYNVHERLERAEAEVCALREKEVVNQFKRDIIHNCMGPDCVICRPSVFEQLEQTVTEVSDRQK